MIFRILSIFVFISVVLIPGKVISQPERLLNEFALQSGARQIETGLAICDSLAETPALLIAFSKKLLDKAKSTVPKTTMLAKVAKAVADGYYYSDSISRSNEFLLEAIQIAESVSPVDTQFIGEAYNDLGMNYQDVDKRPEARFYLDRAIQYLNDSPYISELADAKGNLAALNHSEGKYKEAISLALDVSRLDSITGNKGKQSNSLNNLGRFYVDWEKYETGLDYYFRSLALLDTAADKRTLGIRFNNIGMVYQLMGKHTEAIQWFERAKQLDEAEGVSTRLAIRYFNLGNSFMALKNYEKAESYFEKAERIFGKTELFAQTSKVYVSLGRLYLETSQPAKSGQFLLKALELAEKGGRLPEKSVCYRQLYKYYKTTGQFNKALRYFELHTAAEDSIFNLKVSEQIEELEAQYQNKQKEAEISRLETENELSRKELFFRKRERNWALAGLGILMLFSVSMYILFSVVKQQKKKLATQNTELNRLNQTLNRLFAIISHDLRNASAGYQSSAKVIGYHLEKGHPEKLLPLAPEIGANAKKLSSMLENLLQWSAAQIKGIHPTRELLDAREEIEKIVSLQKDEAGRKGDQFIINGNETVWCDPESFRLIVRNISGNAVKFTTDGKIVFELTQSGGFTLLKISDTGCGIPPGMLGSLFNFGESPIRTGTSGEKGTGLGLPLVAEHVEKNGGSIRVESKEGSGTTFYITFPSKEK